jgi:hypothetical protein
LFPQALLSTSTTYIDRDNFTSFHPEASLDSSWSMLPSPFFLDPSPEKHEYGRPRFLSKATTSNLESHHHFPQTDSGFTCISVCLVPNL